MAKRSSNRTSVTHQASSGSLENLSVSELQAELVRRQRSVVKLQRRREKLLQKLEALNKEISSLGATVRGGGRVRPRNEANLVESLVKVLDGKTMSVTEIAQAVQQAGYQTTSPSFRTIVNQTLISSGKFKRVGRGQYTVK